MRSGSKRFTVMCEYVCMSIYVCMCVYLYIHMYMSGRRPLHNTYPFTNSYQPSPVKNLKIFYLRKHDKKLREVHKQSL